MNELPLAQFEVLPVGRGEEEAARLPEPVPLTVICSPRHGPDRTVAVARRLIASGRLAEGWERKSGAASYITTQLGFQAEVVLAWVRETRQRGVRLPVL